MDNAQPTAPVADRDTRADLAFRIIPRMTLSTAENPLTKPLPPPKAATPAGRAAERFQIEGNAVVTGGAGNLALQASRALLEHGLSGLCIMDLAPTLASSADHIKQLAIDFPDRVMVQISVDVTSPSAVRAAFEQAVSQLPGNTIDILCCFAGIVGCAHSISVEDDDFTRVMNVNLHGSFLCAQAAATHMTASNQGGSILLIASISAHHVNFPQPQVAYNVSKAGVTHLTRNLAVEWAVHGIRVNSISPGYMDTVLNAGDNIRELREMWASRCPMGRMGAVEEITGPVILLCSKTAGRYITGADLLVDGGAMCL